MREYGSEYYVKDLKADFLQMFNFFSTVRFLSTGRDALGLAAGCIGSDGGSIILPAYCCDSMIQPFRKRGWDVSFYPINVDFTVNESELLSVCEKTAPRAVLLMNFFGVAPTNVIASKIKSRYEDIIIIEDFTHTLFNLDTLTNKSIDFFVASIRKWLGVSDGSVFLTDRNCDIDKMHVNTEFVKLRQEGQLFKFRYQYTKDENLKKTYLDTLKKAESLLETYGSVNAVSESGFEILSRLNISNICSGRKINFNHLYNIIKDLEKIKFPVKIDKDSSIIPFSLPVIVENRDMIQRRFADKGLYSQVLWPIDIEARKVCRFSAEMADNMLSLPIDQRYDYDDIEEIGKIVRAVLLES